MPKTDAVITANLAITLGRIHKVAVEHRMDVFDVKQRGLDEQGKRARDELAYELAMEIAQQIIASPEIALLEATDRNTGDKAFKVELAFMSASAHRDLDLYVKALRSNGPLEGKLNEVAK